MLSGCQLSVVSVLTTGASRFALVEIDHVACHQKHCGAKLRRVYHFGGGAQA